LDYRTDYRWGEISLNIGDLFTQGRFFKATQPSGTGYMPDVPEIQGIKHEKGDQRDLPENICILGCMHRNKGAGQYGMHNIIYKDCGNK
jgi:hypothetical protein